LRAKKSYGQHFLINEDLSEKIADSLQLTDSYGLVLEVGPGRGMLTRYLLQKEFELYMVEADRDMVLYLKKHFKFSDHQLIEADFLKIPLDVLFDNRPFGLIGNFPYNISSQILFKMLEYKQLIPEMVGMFQKEVAERIVSKPGNKTYGVISVLIQAFYEGTFLFEVDKSNFSPPPKVQSGVIRLTRKKEQELGCNPVLFKKIVKQAFGQRRKMLRNTLKPFLKDNDQGQLPIFEKRPERLSVADFVTLTNWLDNSERKT